MLEAIFARHGWSLSLQDHARHHIPSDGWSWSDPLKSLWIAHAGHGILVYNFLDLFGAEIDPATRAVRIFPLAPDVSVHTLEHFALDVVLPRVMAQGGRLVLHGALIARGDQGICLVGDSGQGKSTLSAALRQDGWQLHGDDALELDIGPEGVSARAPYPSLRLNPDSLQALGPATGARTPVADYLDKVRIELDSDLGACRLRAMILLSDDDGSGTIALRPMSTSGVCMSLIRQSFALDPTDTAEARLRLATAGAALSSVPGLVLQHPRAYHRLPEVTRQLGTLLETPAALVPAPAS